MQTANAKSNILQAAGAYAQHAHRGKRLKYVRGTYFTHAEAVSDRTRSINGKVLGFLHDVIEQRVKEALQVRGIKDCATPENRLIEEGLIQRELVRLRNHFEKSGHDMAPLIPHLNVLTRRLGDDYDTYIKGIAEFAKTGIDRTTGAKVEDAMVVIEVKIADLEENRDPARNPRGTMLTRNDQERLAKYDRSLDFLYAAFPTVALRPTKADHTQANKARKNGASPGYRRPSDVKSLHRQFLKYDE
jgi:hypothetical protein